MKSFLKFVIMSSMGDSMDFLITLDQFEGPLDLMLHLIKENKLDLFDLDMNVLATQYIEYIHAMQNMHLEGGGGTMLSNPTTYEDTEWGAMTSEKNMKKINVINW